MIDLKMSDQSQKNMDQIIITTIDAIKDEMKMAGYDTIVVNMKLSHDKPATYSVAIQRNETKILTNRSNIK